MPKAAVPSACRPFCLPVLTLLGLLPSICSQSPCWCSPAAKGKSKVKALTSRSSGPCAQWHPLPNAQSPSSCSTSIGDHLMEAIGFLGEGGGGYIRERVRNKLWVMFRSRSMLTDFMHHPAYTWLLIIPLSYWHLLFSAHIPSFSCNVSIW